jgi:hypothetical protein
MAIFGLAGIIISYFIQNAVAQEFNSDLNIQEWDPNAFIDNPFYGDCPTLYDSINHPPVISQGGDPRRVTENTPTFTGARICDVDPNTHLTAEIVSPPAHGTVTISSPLPPDSYDAGGTYTSEPGYIGRDSYSFKINDGIEDSNIMVMQIQVLEAVEIPTGEPPIANAGTNQEVYEGDTVTLDGSASSDVDGTIEKYHWKIEDSPEEYEDPLLSNSESAFPKFIAPEIDSPFATYLFELTVTDNVGLKGDEYVTIKVKDKGTNELSNTNSVDSNTPTLLQTPESTSSYPEADAGPDQQVDEEDLVTLDGSASKGSSYGDIATFSWIQKEGFPYVTLTDSNTANPQFIAPQISEDTPLLFELTVQDEDGFSNTDEVSVIVNDAQTTD